MLARCYRATSRSLALPWQVADAASMMFDVASDPTIKVLLVNDGDDVETPWPIDLGPADGAPPGSRRVRLINVPFMHAKPTWGDVIVVSPGVDRFLTWNGHGAEYAEICSQIAEDGGRYSVILEYSPHPGTSAEAGYKALRAVFERGDEDLTEADAVCEGAFGPKEGRPGLVYLAAKYDLSPELVMERLRAARVPCDVTLIHPVEEPG